MATIQDVLHFWFGDLDDEGRATPDNRKRWFTRDEAFDQAIRDDFQDLHAQMSAGEMEHWLDTPEGLLAYVIVLDQFSRNMFRGTPGMYATDDQALQAAEKGLDRGDDRDMPHDQRGFLYMPFMHSEALEDQQRCVDLFQAWHDELEDGPLKENVANSLDYAVRHLVIVERFGRFPHRNEILGRESTAEEVEFLKEPGSSF